MREKPRLDSARSHGASPKEKSCDQSVRHGKRAILQMRKSENCDRSDFKSRVEKSRPLSALRGICFRLNFIFRIRKSILRTALFAKNFLQRKRNVCAIKGFLVECRRTERGSPGKNLSDIDVARKINYRAMMNFQHESEKFEKSLSHAQKSECLEKFREHYDAAEFSRA